ncbi:MAG: tail fiber protein [Acidobacteriota bacterium]|nr:tail fiber protein [Acidobacteriota bacterium]
MSEPYIGQIMMFGGNFAIRGWAMCNGQLLSIAQNTALFSILGTTYGGNGQTTFALPDLRGRVPVHQGQGPGLSPYTLGQMSGAETTTLVTSNLPAHVHQMAPQQPSVVADGNDSQPANNLPAIPVVNVNGTDYQVNGYRSGTADSHLATNANQTTGITGSGLPFSNIQPYTTLTFLIALEGIFPSRN